MTTLAKIKNPLRQRRWRAFKNHRRGYYSLWIFTALLLISLCADLIANDKPLLLSYKNTWYYPLWNAYPETTFGGIFETEADYRDPAVQSLIQHPTHGQTGWIIWPPIRYHYDTINYHLTTPAPSPPSTENLLGTDDQGRDVLARLIYGYRTSIIFGLILTLLSSFFGVIVGALQGYFGGRFDLLTQRFIEIWSSLPQLFLLIILSSFVTPSFSWLLAIMLLFSWLSLVDVVRAECLRARNAEYVKAARALGVSSFTLLRRHVLPNALVATLTFMPFVLNASISTLTSLDFLGFGLPPGSASLGELLAQGKANIQASWLGISAFITLALQLSLLVFIGEALRDALDPRLKIVGWG